ncbi:DUF1800 domain-containing protein [uncultured Dokdonia sp.]|uniref:DUF1800 domain-containing protein n=1 Tax=uncultured Dokdonia sp. TaxID=575653 RepID=UPI00262BA1C4|nr:DUF1800 domain-containing protein [uncultured Dokdonia sp.]
MEIFTSCNLASITPYEPSDVNPWDIQKVKHVYRRLDYGATNATLNIGVLSTPSELIDTLIQEAIDKPNPSQPEWGFWNINNYTNFNDENNGQINEWYAQTSIAFINGNLKDRLAFFWFNHFVTQLEVYFYAPYLYQYWDLMHTHALGNFRDFVRAVGKSSAMLLYLNGFENTNNSPNENYARELYELFTLGVNNGYTQTDIEETSRALTGYNHFGDGVAGNPIVFDDSTFDNSAKIIFDQEGPWDYDQVITILFEQKADLIAPFICEKLYNFFVSPDTNQEIVNAMAATLLANDFEITPVLEQLFKSEHFYDIDAIGHVIKSPYDLTTTFTRELGLQFDNTDNQFSNFIIYLNDITGQDIFQPPDVAGWQRNRDWINSSTLAGRWEGIRIMLYNFWNVDQEQFRDFAINISGDSNDPALITQSIIDFFMSRSLHTATDYDIATTVFRWEIPDNYYDDGIWDLSWESAPYQVLLLMFHISRMPEFQLK